MYPTAIDADLARPFVDARSAVLSEKVRLVLAPTAETLWKGADRSRVPAEWIAALAAGDAQAALTALGWTARRDILPRTVPRMVDKLAGLGVLIARSEAPTLLYFFQRESGLTVFEGSAPLEASGAPDKRPADVVSAQAIHDGWFEFSSGDLGWLPEEEWQIIGAKRADGETLTGISSKGSALVGFEPGEPGSPARVLWPNDGRVDTPATVFETIDGWTAASLDEALSQS